MGKPIPGIDEPYDPLWWIKSWVARNDLTGELYGARSWRLRDRGK